MLPKRFHLLSCPRRFSRHRLKNLGRWADDRSVPQFSRSTPRTNVSGNILQTASAESPRRTTMTSRNTDISRTMR